ncbi:YeeE/YedE family protein [Methylopila sp. M107]|uniref:YeeE/YedE family protein n=1 Tax=Methylopila sp. M107 TaxID=1101190 RepID=UPI0003653FD3|nr:YeeE/YedE family protein [Methylopila sp. M107]
MTTESSQLPGPAASLVAALVVAAIAASAYALSQTPGLGGRQSFALLAGAAFGIALQRGRFCFLCNLRDFTRERDPRGVLAILVALAVGAIGYAAVFGAWLPNPFGGRLPPTAHIGPAGPALALAAFVFGVGMAISGSCLSAHLYRLGEGSPTSPFALVGAVGGFVTGFLTWNPLYLAFVADSPALWLPARLGYGATLVLTLAALGGLAALVLSCAASFTSPQRGEVVRRSRAGEREQGHPERAAPPHPTLRVDLSPPGRGEGRSFVSDDGLSLPETPTLRGVATAIFVRRWPFLPTGLLIGLIATLYYFRVAPLGVTAELGSAARTAAVASGLLPSVLHGLDGLRGCATVVKETLLSDNGLFVLGLVAASFSAALVSGRFRPTPPSGGQVVRGLFGGALMGWGAMTGLGCTVGVLLSGIHAGAVSGWVFLAFCVAGALVADAAARRASQRTA